MTPRNPSSPGPTTRGARLPQLPLLPLLPLMALLALLCLAPAAAPAFAAGEASAKPTVAEAEKFMAEAEARLLKLYIARDRAQWVAATYITGDTETLAAQANELVIAAAMELAQNCLLYTSPSPRD